MAYRNDPDLAFLEQVPSSNLGQLVRILTKDKDGSPRLTEELTMHDRYKESSPDHHEYWDLIAGEIQCFGANSFATIARGGKGVLYREVLTDVCDKMKVNYSDASPVDVIEFNLLMKVLVDSMAEMSPEDLKRFCDDLNIRPTSFTAEAIAIAIQIMIKSGRFLAYKIAVIVANAVAKALVGRGLSVAANAALTRSMAIFVGPIGWAVSAIWLLVDIAGPAYRVTIPSVILVAYLRLEMAREEAKKAKKAKKKAKKKAANGRED